MDTAECDTSKMRLVVQGFLWFGLLAVPAYPVAVSRGTLPLVQDVVPQCALLCLKRFISSNYPTSICSDTKGLGCLCTQRSLSKLALGEAALQCVLESCPPSKEQAEKAYGMCARIQGAIPNTNSALIATITAVPSRSVTSHIQPSITSKGVGASKIMSHEKTGINVTSSTPISTASPTRTTSTVASDTSIPTPEAKMVTSSKSLSKFQIIGISAGVVIACLVAAGLLFVACWRRSKRNRAKDEPFEIGGTMAEPSPRTFYLNLTRDDRIPRTPIGAYNRSTFEPFTRVPGLRLHNPRNPSPTPTELSQERRDREDLEGRDPGSPSSMRTVSRLLPDKPDLEALANQQSDNNGLKADRPSSSVTLFEEDSDPRRPQSIEKQPIAFTRIRDSTARINLQNQYRGGDRYLQPPIASTKAGRFFGHETQYYPSTGPMYHRDSTQTTNPLAGFSRALMNGSVSSQTLRSNSNDGLLLPEIRPSSSAYSSHRSRTSDDMGSHKTPRLSHRSSLRYSNASSTTSFDTMASEDEKANVKPKCTTRNLSPVKETMSRSPTPPNSLLLPEPNHSEVPRRDDWNKATSCEAVRRHNSPSLQSDQHRAVKPKTGRFPVKPSSSTHPRETVASTQNDGRFLRPIDPRLHPRQHIQSRRQNQGAVRDPNSQGRVSPWEREMAPIREPPKLIVKPR